jgi:hypothetical protein
MAYTKYSLTPADNNAAPPNGAPEGMLPSAVNDTMRDMMSQIRDVGDGIRGGTYTMTAPVITGGSISGLSSLASTGVATFSAGSVSAPAITTTGDTNTGIYFPGADTIAFAEGGVESIRIDSSGNVGIGTSSPGQILEVSKSQDTETQVRVVNANTGSSAKSGFVLGNNSNAGAASILLNSSNNTTLGGANSLNVYMGLSAPIAFFTNATERMKIDSSGNLGVGLTPSAWGTGNSVKAVQLPGVSLWGFANTNAYLNSNSFYNGTNRIYTQSAAATEYAQVGGSHIWSYAASGTAGNTISFLEAMRIDSSGNFMVGTSTAISKITSEGGIAAHGYSARSGTSGSYAGNFFNINWTGAAILWIDTTNIGQIAIVSDYRIKRNIKSQSESGIDKILKLRPITYQMANYGTLFKESEDIKEGFIAHEVQEVIPSGVDGKKDAENQIQSLRVDAILAVAVKAIQEQQTIIEELKAKVAALEAA